MDLTIILIYIVILLISISFHEMAHAIASYLLGDDTARLQNRISLNPLNHFDPFMSFMLPVFLMLSGMPVFAGAKPVMINARKVKFGDYGMALIALAGPLSNFLLAFICFGVSFFLGSDSFAGDIFYVACIINLGLMLFNLIPIPPLDGSRVLYAVAPILQDSMDKIEKFGSLAIFVVIMFASPLIGIYVQSVSELIINSFISVFTFFS